MRLLLDTHIALWAVTDDPKLSLPARALIEDQANGVTISVASLWEIAIKRALRRGRASGDGTLPSADEARSAFVEAGFEMLDITSRHVAELDRLPLIHADPFDRMLVAQAKAETLRLITSDGQLPGYGETVLAV